MQNYHRIQILLLSFMHKLMRACTRPHTPKDLGIIYTSIQINTLTHINTRKNTEKHTHTHRYIHRTILCHQVATGNIYVSLFLYIILQIKNKRTSKCAVVPRSLYTIMFPTHKKLKHRETIISLLMTSLCDSHERTKRNTSIYSSNASMDESNKL